MKKTQFLMVGVSLAALLSLPVTSAYAALEIAFGADTVTRDGGAGGGEIADGETFIVTGPLLQLRMPDGSIASFSRGSEVRLVASASGGVAFDLISGTARFDATASPVQLFHNGAPISVAGGQFVTNIENGGLTGRSLGGPVRVTDASNTVRQVNGAEGFVVDATGGVTRSVAGASNVSPQGSGATGSGPRTVAGGQNGSGPQGQAGASSTGSFSPTQRQGAGGGSQLAALAGQSLPGGGASGRTSGGGGATGGGSTGGGSTGGGSTGGGTYVDPASVTGTEVTGNVIAYAADAVGIDTRTNVQTTTNAGGELLRYKVGDGSNEDVARNTSSTHEQGGAGGVHVERWAAGATSGNYYNNFNGTSFSQLSRSANQGYHFAYGQAAASLPAQGLATYQLASATKPTVDDGSFAPGTFTGTMGVLFGAQFGVGVDFAVDMPGDHVYAIRTPGGAANPTGHVTYFNAANKTFSLNDIAVAQGGYSCPTAGCKGIVQGFLGGNQGDAVGLTYQVVDFSAPSDANHRGRRISGAAAFTQSAFDANPSVGGGGAPAPVSSGSVGAKLQPNLYYQVTGIATGQFGGFSQEGGNRGALFGADGAMTSFTTNSGGGTTYLRNDAVTADLAGSDYIQIGRWNGGTVRKGSADLGTYNGRQGLLYVAAPSNATPRLPATGIATYSLTSSVAPIVSSGNLAPGTFSGTAALAFGNATANLGLNAQVTMAEPSGSVIYDISTAGGTANPLLSQISVNSSDGSLFGFYTVTSPNGLTCPGTANNCNVNVSGRVAGPEARDLGLLYRIGNGNNTIGGAALFQRNDKPELANTKVGVTSLIVAPGGLALTNSPGVFAENNGGTVVQMNAAGTQITKLDVGTRVIETGTASIFDAGSVAGLVSWQRWSGGTPGGNSFGNSLPALSANQAFHVFTAAPGTDLPTSGTVNYALAGSTSPTIADGSVAPGTFSGSMAVAFGAAPRVGVDFDVNIGGHNYDIVSAGGLADPSLSQLRLSGSVFGPSFGQAGNIPVAAGGPACTVPNNCGANVSGVLSGVGGTHAAVGYTISSGNGSPNNTTAVQGVAVFAAAP